MRWWIAKPLFRLIGPPVLTLQLQISNEVHTKLVDCQEKTKSSVGISTLSVVFSDI
jgi:hypothetical protein